MQVQVEQQDAFIKKLSVTLESGRVSGAIDAAFKRVAQKLASRDSVKAKLPATFSRCITAHKLISR